MYFNILFFVGRLRLRRAKRQSSVGCVNNKRNRLTQPILATQPINATATLDQYLYLCLAFGTHQSIKLYPIPMALGFTFSNLEWTATRESGTYKNMYGWSS